MNHDIPLAPFCGLLTLLTFAGCERRDEQARPAEVNSPSPSVASSDVSSVSDARAAFSQILQRLAAARERAIEDLCETLPKGRPVGATWAERTRELRTRWDCVAAFADTFCDKTVDAARLWNAQAEMLKTISAEIDRVASGNAPEPRAQTSGLVLSRRAYLQGLETLLSEAVRTGFEYGRFARYYHGLPAAEQRRWSETLERLARRNVVIWNPDGSSDCALAPLGSDAAGRVRTQPDAETIGRANIEMFDAARGPVRLQEDGGNDRMTDAPPSAPRSPMTSSRHRQDRAGCATLPTGHDASDNRSGIW